MGFCESFAFISIDSLLVYLQLYLDNCTYKVLNTQMVEISF